MTRKYFGTKLLATALATFALASCQSESSLNEPSSDNRREVELTVSATKGDLQTRTDLNLDKAELKIIKTWDLNDRVHVCEADGNYVGYLEVTGLNDDKTEATFKGVVRLLDRDGIHKLSFSTIGKEKDANYSAKSGKTMSDVEYNFAEQTSTDIHALDANDLMITDCDVVVSGQKAQFTNLILRRQFAYGRFTLLYNDEPLTFAAGTKVIIDTENSDIQSGATIAFPKTITASRTSALEVTTDKNDFYVVFVPGSEKGKINFTVTVNGEEYVGYSNEYLIEKNDFFRKATGGALPINVKHADGSDDQVEYGIIFKEDPEGTKPYDWEDLDLTDPENVVLPGDPKPEDHKEFLGWKIEGSNDEPTKGPWNLTEEGKGPKVTLVPVYSGNYIWNIRWENGYDGQLVPEQGQETYVGEPKNLAENNRPKTPYGLSKNNPTRDGFYFNGWSYIRPSNKEEKTVGATSEFGPMYTECVINNWTITYKALWKRTYEIVYHFNSADPNHSNSAGEEHAGYNAKVIDCPVGVENGYSYSVIMPGTASADRFNDHGGVALTQNGGKFIGWRKMKGCADQYTDADAARTITSENNTWEFKGGKYILHLEPVYSDPNTISTPGYEHGDFQ